MEAMATITKARVRPDRAKSQPRPAGPTFNRARYIKLIENALPIPPVTEADNERLIATMMEIDDRGENGEISAEEKAFSELLTIVIQDFEDRHYQLPKVPPHEMLQYLAEERGLKHKDLAAIIGNKGSTTEILAGRRKIPAATAKRLAAEFKVPVDVLL